MKDIIEVKTLSKKQEKNLEKNFRKLWLMEKVNFPFKVAVRKIQEEWKLPIKGDRPKARKNVSAFIQKLNIENKKYLISEKFRNHLIPIIKSIKTLKLSKCAQEKIFIGLAYDLPALRFKRQIEELQKRFAFEGFWFFNLVKYIITGKIFAPYEKKSKGCPPEHIIDDWKIFHLTCKKQAQHKFLKKKGFTKKQIGEMTEYTNLLGLLPDKLIYSNLNIAEKIWGDWDKDDISDNELKKLDENKENLVKQRYKRFKKKFIPLNSTDIKILKSLKLSS